MDDLQTKIWTILVSRDAKAWRRQRCTFHRFIALSESQFRDDSRIITLSCTAALDNLTLSLQPYTIESLDTL